MLVAATWEQSGLLLGRDVDLGFLGPQRCHKATSRPVFAYARLRNNVTGNFDVGRATPS